MTVKHKTVKEQTTEWRVGSLAINGKDALHEFILKEKLQEFVALEAQHHGAKFDHSTFKKVVSRIEKGLAYAYAITASTHTEEKILTGCIIEYPTIATTWDGAKFVHKPALYGEDFLVTKEASDAFKAHTHAKSLGTVALIGKMHDSAADQQGVFHPSMKPSGMVMEYADGNTPIENLFSNLGVDFDENKKNNVLYFNSDYSCSRLQTNGIKATVEGLGIIDQEQGNIVSEPHVFVVSAKDESGRELSLSFTEGLSTFTGKPLIRSQITSNQALTMNDKAWVKKALVSAFRAAKEEVTDRNWFTDGDKITTMSKLMQSTIFHAKGEDVVVAALRELGAETRMLGKFPMLPMNIDFNSLPDGVMQEQTPCTPYFPIQDKSGDVIENRRKGPGTLTPVGRLIQACGS